MLGETSFLVASAICVRNCGQHILSHGELLACVWRFSDDLVVFLGMLLMMLKKKIAVALASALSVLPLAVQAQEVPTYSQQLYGVDRIQGRIASFDGGYDLRVRDERGYIDRVHIHPGTIINPTGITLTPGMVVSIVGENEGDYFSGDEVDTPYTIYGGVPYYRDRVWTDYGNGFALGFFFANTNWWHGSYFNGYHYGWSNGYRRYSIPNYHPGAWHGAGEWRGDNRGEWRGNGDNRGEWRGRAGGDARPHDGGDARAHDDRGDARGHDGGDVHGRDGGDARGRDGDYSR